MVAIITRMSSSLLLTAMLIAGYVRAQVQYKTPEYVGCYSSAGRLSLSDSFTYQSTGHCQEQCIPQSGNSAQAVMGLNTGSDCWCGDSLPSDDDKVDDDECDEKCTGFGEVMCGGKDTFSVYLTGLEDDVPVDEGSTKKESEETDEDEDDSIENDSKEDETAQTNPPSTFTGRPVIVTKAGETVVITASSEPINPDNIEEAAPDDTEGGPNKVGIAVGVVVGVVALGALIGAAIFFIRRRKRRAVEDEYRRNQAMGSLVNNDKMHSKSGSVSDQRLDPSISHRRRQSDGSIADELDFTRKILQVSRTGRSAGFE